MGYSHIFMSKQELYEEKQSRMFDKMKRKLAIYDIDLNMEEFDRIETAQFEFNVDWDQISLDRCYSVEDIIADIEGML